MLLDRDSSVFQTVLAELPVAVCLVDRERKVAFWNRAAEKISGHMAHEVIGRSCRGDLLVDSHEERAGAAGIACHLTQTMRDGEPREADVFLLHKGGHRLLVHVHTVPLRDSRDAIVGAVETIEEVRIPVQRRRARRQADFPDHLDFVSGLPDKASMKRHAQEALREFQEERVPFCVLQMQPDGLDRLRSKYGKGAVEAVLQVTAQTLSCAIYPGDIAGCFDGDQFLAIMRDCPKSALKKVSERVRRMTDYADIEWWGDRVPITISIGAAAIAEEDTLESLLARAEEALRQSVKCGGDRVTVLPEEQD